MAIHRRVFPWYIGPYDRLLLRFEFLRMVEFPSLWSFANYYCRIFQQTTIEQKVDLHTEKTGIRTAFSEYQHLSLLLGYCHCTAFRLTTMDYMDGISHHFRRSIYL